MLVPKTSELAYLNGLVSRLIKNEEATLKVLLLSPLRS